MWDIPLTDLFPQSLDQFKGKLIERVQTSGPKNSNTLSFSVHMCNDLFKEKRGISLTNLLPHSLGLPKGKIKERVKTFYSLTSF